jgi:hypothetical protein
MSLFGSLFRISPGEGRKQIVIFILKMNGTNKFKNCDAQKKNRPVMNKPMKADKEKKIQVGDGILPARWEHKWRCGPGGTLNVSRSQALPVWAA